jgi:DNA-binding MarR family transcriptional regulator
VDASAEIDKIRAHNLGRLLHAAFRQYHRAALQAVQTKGHRELTLAHTQILPHIARQGSRLTEIAAAAEMTKQSASELIASLEALGYLRRETDPADRRAQRVMFTRKGQTFLRDVLEVKLALREELERKLGKHGSQQLTRLLERYLAP